MRKHTFHILGLPHTRISKEFNGCAYSQKLLKFITMMVTRGHTCTLYSNDGAEVDCENVPMLTEDERSSWFANPTVNRNYQDIRWDQNEPYWQLFNARAVAALVTRVKNGDFILTPAGWCNQPVANAFPGCLDRMDSGVGMVDAFCGYYGPMSKYIIYESITHREWMHGKRGSTVGTMFDAVIPNYWDMREFGIKRDESVDPYYLFVGRIIPDKGWNVAVEVTRDIGAKLVMAGQGDPGPIEPHVTFLGHVSIEERNKLMTNSVAVFCPTDFREPFGGTAVESQLNGTPAITTDHGAFCQTVAPEWRCTTHREFCEAARRAATLGSEDRATIKAKATALYSLEAVAPQFERYFDRILSLWWSGYYEMRDLDGLELP